MRKKSTKIFSILLGISLSAAIVSCATTRESGLSDRYPDGSDTSYMSRDGSVKEFTVDERKTVDEFSGPLDSGVQFSSDSLLGNVTVINFWYAGCPPCRVEAKDLEAVHQEFLDQDVEFLGVNVRDTESTSLTFAENFGISYHSLLDVQQAEAQLAFAGVVPPNVVPTTLVLDRENHVAARILGVVDPSILRTLVSDVLAESN